MLRLVVLALLLRLLKLVWLKFLQPLQVDCLIDHYLHRYQLPLHIHTEVRWIRNLGKCGKPLDSLLVFPGWILQLHYSFTQNSGNHL